MNRTNRPVRSARRPSREAGFSTFLTLLVAAASLLAGAFLVAPYLETHALPGTVAKHLPSTTTPTATATATIDDATPSLPPSLRAGRHATYDRVVLTAVHSCEVDEIWSDVLAAATLRVRCDESLADLRFGVARPVDAGLENIVRWDVERGDLLLHLAVDFTWSEGVQDGDRWVLDIADRS
ncbi:hypothetical protein ACE2AJ_09900 [Aquihabitans daechungensis]|uniref:hypothetical protein n=1 Tax=Aquihabitans daechungensis TaxID=1052257 RepID=UPI003BA004C0